MFSTMAQSKPQQPKANAASSLSINLSASNVETKVKTGDKATFKPTSPYPYPKSFYRRSLPSPPSIAFSSVKGRELFKESMQSGFMEGYFILAEQFRTQDEPAFCGLSTLTMVLNALNIDPKRVWKGPWRWYIESMLDCCKDLPSIKEEGITFDEFACLGRCNGLYVKAKRPTKWKKYNRKNKQEPPIVREQIDSINDDIHNNSNNNNNGEKNDSNDKNENKTNDKNESSDGNSQLNGSRQYYTIDEFRQDVKLSCVSSNGPIVIISYSRQEFKQTGDGHFSPIAGYNEASDMALIMDVARFKYPPHWVGIENIYSSMCRVDKETDKTRGWLVVHNSNLTKSLFFTWNHPISDTIFKSENYDPNEIYENSLLSILEGEKCQHCDICILYCDRFPNAVKNLIDSATGKDKDKDEKDETQETEKRHKEKKTGVVSKASETSHDQGSQFERLGQTMCTCVHDDVSAVLSCIFQCFGKISVDQLIGNYSERFHIQLSEKHEIIRNKLVKGIQSTGMYDVMLKLYETNECKKVFENISEYMTVEVVTLMILVIDDQVWDCLKNSQLAKEIKTLNFVGDEYPELRHEINVLRYQLLYLKDLVKSRQDRLSQRIAKGDAKNQPQPKSNAKAQSCENGEDNKKNTSSGCGCQK